MIKKIFRFLAEYFVFLGGLLFIFTMGAIYAFLQPEGTLVNITFLIIVVGWIIFLIKYFWDLVEKDKKA
ncbi:hypothetical protein A2686_02290 [Candidatus Woesebacteria bacterium RIFCSPHIGHO2_01_FULL_38_10]|uniref:Uncharacterized protein n=1 Tax=Candidatus Woesebacteria bacterium RIFCSPLOWO2_01_FULL_39_10b TaxID=1802517 RepID=A0A1F8B9V9_9BACT|nr:MAG: hypothetical protein A2686_02290 [Candidatus Woesebacteria bacterium RIFCSPHIGHO2_01_FULL_38_10]OGM60807.1 MAG: hypothetical protein A2892_02065 [Candidatus Woesebacteria bacterium RIFCSPLOWO2_01_FULL_39_10b]